MQIVFPLHVTVAFVFSKISCFSNLANCLSKAISDSKLVTREANYNLKVNFKIKLSKLAIAPQLPNSAK